jgi:septum formation protein
MTGLVLASSSAVRARLLEEAGVPFEISPAWIDEEGIKSSLVADGKSSRDIADALSELKALRVSASQPESLVLGADQVLVFEGNLVSKSATLAEATALLRRLRGHKIELYAGAVLARGGLVAWRHVSRAELWMRPFGDAFLEDYLEREGERVLGSVGCFQLEGLGAQLFSRIEGDYFCILGLPLLPLLAALREQGVIAK